MPRKLRINRRGREFLRGPRFDVRRKTLSVRKGRAEPFVPVVVDGHALNEPESRIYRGLAALQIPFEAQVSLGPGRELGGALVDFVLPAHGIALEYQGPFHNIGSGPVRDFWRDVTRTQSGLETVYLYENDLKNKTGEWSVSRLMGRLRELLGSPVRSSLMTRSSA